MDAADAQLSPEIGLLLLLQREASDANGLSLPRLRKVCDLPLSQLQRLLGRLEASGLVCVEMGESGIARISLSESTRALVPPAQA